MLAAILKLSYNKIGESPVTGGICGSCFFVSSSKLITAKHVLNKKEHKPNNGFAHCQYWLLFGNKNIEISSNYFTEFPEIDLTIITLPKELNNIIPYQFSGNPSVGSECYNDGYHGGDMPIIDAGWENDKFIISNSDLGNVEIRGEGKIVSIKNAVINTKDIKIKNKKIIELSYGGHEGMSGGPLIDKKTDKVIGLMSFGLPPNEKTKKQLYAISSKELLKIINNLNII